MERKILIGTDLILFITVTLAWDCSDRGEQKKHTWCENGCCFDKDPVRCCTWAESMGSVFWTLMGLGAGMLLLSIIVGVVCCMRKKEGTAGVVISLRQDPSREGSALNSFSTSPRNTPRTPTAPNINSNVTHHTDRNVWTLSQTNETSSSNGNLRQSTNRATSPNHNINSVTNNTNTGTGQQARSQLNAQRNTEQPPSHESLPPSYSSLFNANS